MFIKYYFAVLKIVLLKEIIYRRNCTKRAKYLHNLKLPFFIVISYYTIIYNLPIYILLNCLLYQAVLPVIFIYIYTV